MPAVFSGNTSSTSSFKLSILKDPDIQYFFLGFGYILTFFSTQPMVVPTVTMHHVSISASSTQVVSEVLSKMIMVGITDPGEVCCLLFFVPRQIQDVIKGMLSLADILKIALIAR